MSKIRIAFIILVMPLMCLGCRDVTVQKTSDAAYVAEAVSNPGINVKDLLERFDPKSSDGAIVVLDKESRCILQSAMLLNQDLFDNIDGAGCPDYLADFAGEIISSVVIDSAAFSGISLENVGPLSVKYALSAICGDCSDDPFDPAHRTDRPDAKVLILGSTVMSAASEDIKALLRGLGLDIPVLTTVGSSINYIFSKQSASTPVIGVILDHDDMLGVEAYKNKFNEAKEASGENYSRCFVFNDVVEEGDELFRAFMRKYSSAGYTAPLTAIIVDSEDVDMNELVASLELIQSEKSIENTNFLNLMARDFEMLNAMELANSECYTLMRSRNVFTHNIAYPKSEVFKTSGPEDVYVKSASISNKEYVQN